MNRWWIHCVLASLAIVVACGEHHEAATGLMVVVDAEPTVIDMAAGMRFAVRKGEGAGASVAFEKAYSAIAGDLIWPRTVSLSPRDSAENPSLEIVAAALDANGEALATVRAITRYEIGHVKRLSLLIEARCLGVTCGPTQTCRARACIDATIDPSDLPDFETSSDGGIDARVIDGGSDASMDECRADPASPCGIVCVERCNGEDDDCDGVIDNNGASSSCDTPNAEAACSAGVCHLVSCQGTYADCNGEEEDGCEALLGTPDNCGVCGAVCEFPNAGALCVRGTCVSSDCDEGFGECDGQPNTGCETALNTLTHCGSCLDACEVGDHALPTCAAGVCSVAECLGNFADCDGNPENGCEQGLDEPDNCGECGMSCAGLPNGSGTCGAMGCEGVVCVGAFQDCNGLANDGCEATLDEPAHCGACGLVCDLPNVSSHRCDMTGAATCAIDTSIDDGCDEGFADCNGEAADGCERALNTNADCGACNTPCATTHGFASCESGSCELLTCAPGFADCDGNDTCESVVNDADNCGACGNVCPNDMAHCSGGRCRATACPSGQGDCNDDDACETLNTASNCGGCGLVCPATVANGTASCASGGCVINCSANFANCDGNPANGCETDLRTTEDCRACGTSCASANGMAACGNNGCGLGACDSGFGNCDGSTSNGCEASLNTPSHCGSCSNSCTGRPNSTGGGCSNGTCALMCVTGYRDCDGLASNGCEVAVNTIANCGACGNNCAALPHVASANCTSNGCQIVFCSAGFADCDGFPFNGCERPLNTSTDCGACNALCSFPNAAASCGSGICTMGGCNTGFGDCDNSVSDGCETQLNTTDNCGACGTTCANNQVCNNGACGLANCPSGFSYCGGTTCIDIRGSCPPWPGCTSVKPNKDHCGSCDHRCPMYDGEWCCL